MSNSNIVPEFPDDARGECAATGTKKRTVERATFQEGRAARPAVG